MENAPSPVDLAVKRQLISLLFGTPSVLVINGIIALVTAVVLWRIFPFWISLSWFIFVSLWILAARLILWSSRFTRLELDGRGVDEWARRYTLSTATIGCVWGLVGATIFVTDEAAYHVFAAFVIGGMCAGAAIRLSPYPPSFYAFILPSASPIVLALFLHERLISMAMGSCLLVFIAVMVVVGLQNHQHLAEFVRLRSEQEILNADLKKVTQDLTEQISEKEKVTRALEESSERFRAIGDNAFDAIIISDSEGGVVYWNPAAQRTFGYTCEEAVGSNVHSLLTPPQNREEALKQYAEFAGGGHGEVLGSTLRLMARRKDGTEFPADLSLSTMILGGRWHALGILRDVSEQEKTLAVLRRRECDLTTLAKLSDMLQSCHTVTEAFPIVAENAAILLPGASGSLAIVNAGTQEFTCVSAWGPDSSCSPPGFRGQDCHALREDCEYESDGLSLAAQCQHLSAFQGKPYVCVPLKVHGETRGLLSLVITKAATFDDATRQILHSFGDVIKLSLANLGLLESLAEQATRDPLTGLFNRRYLMEALLREIRRAQRRSSPLTVSLLDIDHFKQFNDSYGHEAGDLVLTELAAQFVGTIREEDVACRYGGDEFLFLLPDCDLAAAYRRMTDISLKTNSKECVLRGKLLPSITISIGLAALSEGLSTADSLITAADKAMYAAKRMGRSRIEWYGSTVTELIEPSYSSPAVIS